MRKRKILLANMLIIAIVFSVLVIWINKNKKLQISNSSSPEFLRALTYNQITDTDGNIENCEYVKFNSFFIKDLDGDGYAEKYDGACNAIEEEETLYFEIDVIQEGYLENGKITIDGKNFKLSTKLIKDNVIKQDYIGKDIKQIDLNTINSGTKKLFYGSIKSDIADNINNYSVSDNKIILTGTWKSADGSQSIEINKEITLKKDWYGKTETTEYENNITNHDIKTAITSEDIALNFDIGFQETKKELLIQKQVTEIEVPDLNGYAPTEVLVTSQNCEYNYNPETKILTIVRKAVTSDSGKIIQSVSRYNNYSIQFRYPLEAYESSGTEDINIEIASTGYYYGFNNTSEEFSNENPYVSQFSKTYTHAWSAQEESETNFKIDVGKSVYNSDLDLHEFVVLKELPLNIYNNIGQSEENDTYRVTWKEYAKDIDSQIYMEENQGDKFLKSDGTYIDMKNYVKTTGIYFSYVDGCLAEDGWIKVYDKDTGELLLTLTKEEAKQWREDKPYTFEKPVETIRIETSKPNANSFMYITQIKTIDDEKLCSEILRKDFDELTHIYSYMKAGKIVDSIDNETNSSEGCAIYRESVSCMNFVLKPSVISNQETANIKMSLSTSEKQHDQKYWTNGEFVIEFPETILQVKLNLVEISNVNVEVSSVETYEKNNKKYIKLYTKTNNPEEYIINIDADIIADPRKTTSSELVNLYAINENHHNYRETSRIEDTLDINGDGNTSEYVLYKKERLQIVAPLTLITSQTATNFDNKGTEVVAPNIAIVEKSNTTAKVQINQLITNNYNRKISEIKIIGKVPFKGNTHQTNGKDMGSTFTTTMKSEGITLPDEVKDIAKVYYSENENVTTDIADTTNNWKLASEITDWSNIKTFIIDLGEYGISKAQTLKFNYIIEIPKDIEYNEISYSDSMVEFCLNTPDGKLESHMESNKLGIMVAKQYDLNLTKFKKGTNSTVKSATYKITDGKETKTATTNNNGTLRIEGLYVNKEYTLKEIQTPANFILNTDEIKFKVTIDDQGGPQLNIIEGNLKTTPTIVEENTGLVAGLQVEDIAKYDMKVINSSVNNEKTPGIKFKLTGGIYGTKGRIFTSDENGEIFITSLDPDEEYILEEIKVPGYYSNQKSTTFKIVRESDNTLRIISDNTDFSNGTITEKVDVDKALVEVNLIRDEIPEYTLTINKENKNGEKLEGTQFKLESVDTGDISYYITDKNGSIKITNLYQYVDGKDLTGEYILKEISATSGYITDSTEIRFKVEKKNDEFNITLLSGETAIKSQDKNAEGIILNFENKEIFKLIKKGDNDTLLPGVVFKITDLEGNTVYDINNNPIGKLYKDGQTEYYGLVTDEKGIITANLPQGLYKLVEMKTVEGYVLPEKEEDRTYYVGIGANRVQENTFTLKSAKSITGSGSSIIYEIEVTKDGGYVAVGSFTGACDIDGDGKIDAISQGDYDQLVIKYGSDENVEWFKTFGGSKADELKSISISDDGGYVVSGFESKDKLEDAIVMKLDASGNEVWKNTIGGTYKDEMNSAKVLSNGDIVAVGRYYSSEITIGTTKENNTALNNGFIVSYDSAGNYKWHQTLKGNEEPDNINVTSVTETANGIVFSANFVGKMTVAGNAITSSGNQDSIIVGLGLDGTYQWNNQIAGKNNETITKLITDEEDNIIAVGSFASELTLGKEVITPPTDKYSNGIMIKLASLNGEYISNYTFGGIQGDDKIVSAETTEDGGLVLGGWFYSDNFDLNNDGTDDITKNSGENDGIIIKLNHQENVEWYRTIKGKNHDAVYDVSQLPNKDIIAVGYFDSTSISTEDVNKFLSSQGYNDSFITIYGDKEDSAEIPEIQEINVKNNLEEFKITTEIAENSDGEKDNGTITGTTSTGGIKFVEKVKYGYNSTTPIVITPNTNYSVYDVEINGEKVDFKPDENGIVTIPVLENVKKDYHIKVTFERNLSNVTVHHYIKDRDGNYTTTQLADDEYITGKVGDAYETAPKINIDGYEIEKDAKGSYVIPDNAKGTYSENEIIVNYYYEEIPVTLTVQHYLEGTEEKLMEDEVSEYYKGTEYTTKPSEELLKRYVVINSETKVTPSTAGTSGTIQESTTVSYYYKLKEFKITTEVKLHEETDEKGTTTQVKGGSISGESMNPYETVIIDQTSKKDIIMTADTGYKIKAIIIQTKAEDGTITEENIAITGKVTTYTLNKFEKLSANKHIIVEYEKIVGTITVHHYIKDTTTKLSENVIIQRKYGESYTTSVAKDIPEQYELVQTPANAKGTLENDEIVITYYYQLKSYKYTVNYLEKGTDKIIHEAKQGEALVYGSTVNITDEKIAINGYNYDSADKEILTIGTKDNIINIYYTKRTDLSYTVNYLEAITNKVIHTPKTQPGVAFETKINAEDEAINIEGYNYDYPDKYELIVGTDENVINIYYSKVTGLSYTVNYLEKGTNKVLSPSNNQGNMTFGDIIKSSDEKISIDGYNYDSVDKDSLTITTGTNVINIYYTKRNDLNYKVNYLEKGTNKVLHDQKLQNNMTFESTVTSANEVIAIDGYKYDLVDKETLTITTSENVINIYYTKRNDLSYKVNYLEKTTNKVLHTQKIQGEMTFESTVTSANEVIAIDGYKYDSVDKETLTITTGENIINIYYTKRNDLSYKINYLEKTTNKVLHNQKVQGGMTFESTVTSANEVIEIDGYNYDSVDKDNLTIQVGENVINIYYTKRNDLSYTVNYLEKNTNIILHEPKTTENMVFESAVNSSDEVIDIDGYNYDSVDKETITIQTVANVINVYYTKRNDLSYTVHYLEKDTNKVLKAPKVTENMTFGTVITSEDEGIKIDGYKYDSVDKDSLTITTGANIINVYYTKVTGLSYTVNYLEKDTDEVIHPAKITGEQVFEAEIISADEVIDIDGYNYNSVDKDTLIITTGENVINVYYTKRNDLSYTVNYLEKDTNKVLHEQKNQTGMTFKDTVASADEALDINGYNYDSADKEILEITTGENVINIYYTKKTNLSYKVNYLEKTTNKVLHTQKVQNKMTFESIVTSSNEVIEIDGYNYDSADKETLTITTSENVINIYYTKRNDLSYKVNYLEKTTNKVLHDTKVQESMTFESTVTSSDEVINIDGYNYDSADKETLTITTGENVINIYYTKRNDLSYKVNYLEKGTNQVLHDQKTQDGMTFESAVTSSDEVIDIDGYNYDSVDKATLTIQAGDNVINIYYTKRNDLSYTVNYLEKGTNKVLHDQKVQNGMTFEAEVKSADEVIEINGYKYDSSDKASIKMTTGENIINIYYTKVDGLSYTVNYLEKGTNEVINPAKTKDGMTFESIVNSSDEVIEIDGYNFDSVDKATLTIGTKENIINIYYIKRTDLNYKVNYLEKETNKVLHDEKVQENMRFKATVNSSNEVINIDGYKYDSVDKEILTIGTGDNVINIYYTKRTDLSYKVNYLEKTTNKVLHNQKIQEGMTFESVVTSANEVIKIDGYNYDSADKATLKITTVENVINIYYTKRNDLNYKVNYLEKTTNKVLHEQKVQDGMTFESVVTSVNEVINIDGYNYDSADKETLIITTGENIINIYYTKRNDLSYTVNYLEKDTNIVLHEPKVTENMTFETAIESSKEIIDIDGYNYDSVDKDKLTITTSENIINIYYKKRNDLSYTVNYLEKDTNKVLNAPKVTDNMIFGTEITSKDEVIKINGYKYDSVDKDSLKITTGANIINVYYTKVTGLSYTVNYLEKDTDEVIHPAKTTGEQVFETEITSADEVIDIDGYNYDSVDKDKLIIGTGENVINIYYTKRNDLSYTVNYLEKDTNKVLHVQKNQTEMTFKAEVKSADEKIDIDGYNYDSVDKDSLTITTGENVINIYYTKRTDLSYKVNYLEKTTNKVLHEQKVQENMTFESVVTSTNEVINIDGYNYDSVDKATLKITTGENVINIYYIKRNDLSYTVNYLEKTTNKVLHNQKVQEGMTFGDTIKSSDEKISIDGYNYDSVDKDSLTIGTGENVINIYYTKRNDLSYKVNYLEKGTNKVLHDQKIQDKMTFESIVTSANEVIEIDGYNYDSVDKATLTITTGENVINIYYIKRTDLSYKVNYLEKGTDKVLHNQKIQEEMTFDATVNSVDEVIDIDGYKYDSVDKTSIKITTSENVINIYYTKVNGLSYTVNYLEKGTNEVIHPVKTKDGMTFQDVVTSRDEIISIDGYDYDSVDKETLTITTGENVINIYYTKRTDLNYKVNYLEKGTNKVLHNQKVQEGMTFESAVTSANEVIEIDGYNYNSVDKETLKITTEENVINIYYTKRNDLNYKVNYLEKDTNKVLHNQKVQEGMTFESTITSSDEVINIDGYNYDSVDKDSLTIQTGENVINVYYTKRIDLSYKVNYLEKTTNKVLHNQKTQDGMTFESVVTSANEVIDIDGYNYDSVDKETLTITTGENVINIYYTKRNDLSYTVNYIEKDTNIVLHEQKTNENIIFESVINSQKEVIDIDGYNYNSVDKDTLVIGTGKNIINIYYTKRNDLSYTVNYLEKDTNRTIHAPKIAQNMTFGTEITSSKEVITINGYSYDSVDKAGIVITTGENVINIYYTKVIGLSYTVNYLEKDTNEVIHEPKTTDNMIFENEITSSDEVIEIDGYDYDSVDKEKLVIGTGENVINIYYTKRIDLEYEVNFLEKGTNKVLSKMKIKKGMKFKDIVKSSDEIIEIDGYNFSDVDKDILEILTSGNVINIYYTKREDVSYKVNYLEKGTNQVLHEQKVQENMTFESVIKASDEVIDIYGYNYDSADNESITLTTGENVINIYYTKKDTKVTVHYYEEGTTNKVSEDVEIPGKVFDDYTTTSADDIPSKYELVAEPENKKGTMTENEITVIYYYRKKATQVIVHYYEENTIKKLSEDVIINGRVDDKYTTISAIDIPIKYELVATPSNANGSMTEATMEVIYYYRVKDAVVNVRYLEKGTEKVLAEPDRIDGKVDEDYQTIAKEIEGYKLIEHTGNEKGKFEVEPLTITYYYLYKTKATVQYIDMITGQILEQSTTEGLEGDDFVTESKDFENYVLVEEPAEKTVKMTKKEQVLKYYYIHVSGGVIEKHIDVISGQILANAVHNGNEGDTYNIPSRTFDGYDLVEDRLPSNAKGTMKVEPVEVIYYYIYRSQVTAEYIDKNTGNKLTDDVVQKGHEGDNYTTDKKSFDDYKLVEVPSNADGSMTKEDIKVTYYYVHTSGGVIVNHIDIKTGKQLLDETKEEGYEGDPYETHEENIPEYDLVKEKYPENATGKMTIEPTRVTYYYIKKTEVNVKYVDKETGEEIDESTNIPGHEGDDYKTEPKDVPGYDLIEEPENKDGTMTADPIEVIYYYKRPAKVIVNYYDIDTKEKLADEIEITGHQNDEYTTEQKDIKYYEIAKVPENKEGKMIVTVTKDENDKEIVDDTTYVNYYYRKLEFNLRVDKTITSVIVNGQETPINGNLGKVEVHRKNISTSNVKVVYKIKVTNDSELTGKANVVENIPSGMTMIADNNPGWTINETTASIETDEIKPGESREYQVVLGWQNGDSNVGTKENIASIITENEAGFEEKDKSDNESKADLIVAVGTGEIPYVAIAGSILLIMIAITSGIYVIKKKQ